MNEQGWNDATEVVVNEWDTYVIQVNADDEWLHARELPVDPALLDSIIEEAF